MSIRQKKMQIEIYSQLREEQLAEQLMPEKTLFRATVDTDVIGRLCIYA